MSSAAAPGELRRLFDLVCDLSTAQRQQRLREEGADAAMIGEIETLLASEGTLAARARTPIARLLESQQETELDAGDVLGAWRLLRRLGIGGMGAVYLAERADGHFEQTAAIKLIRGVAGAETFALFARERQFLATLQHPNIARLLDGGATPGGQPYLVMEYVEGVPVDQYCDEHGLDLHARLQLFRVVCAAVQFAHQRLIVHCDLKPSNVLVRVDGTPVLLDFGIARALDRPRIADSGDAAYFTPGYASPEQLRGESVTTASDVYALGLILFELIAGRKAREDTADRTVSQLGRAEVRPSELAAAVPWRARMTGDLDAIVLHATAEQPAARYASAQTLADDLRRYIEHRPVLARAQTLRYRAARLLRRRWPIALASALVMLLLAGFTWRLAIEGEHARVAEREAKRQAATAERVSDFLVSVFDVSNPRLNADRRDISAREVLDEGAARIDRELVDAPQVKAHLLDVLATAYRHLGQPKESVDLFRKAVELYRDARVDEPLKAAEALSQLAIVYSNNAFPNADAEAAARLSLALRSEHAPDDAQAIADSWNTLGVVLDKEEHYPEAEAALRKALALRSGHSNQHDLGATLHNLGLVASHRGEFPQALDFYQQSLAIKRQLFGEHHPDYQVSLQNYARAIADSGKPTQAIPLLEQNLALSRELYGGHSAKLADANNVLAYVQHDLGAFAQAIENYSEAMRIHAEVSGEDSAAYAVPLNNLAYAHEDMGDYAAAIPLYERSLAIRRKSLPESDGLVMRAHYNLARVLTEAGRSEPAGPHLDTALAGMREHFGENDANTAKAELLQADRQLRSKQFAAAAQTLAQLEKSGARFTPLMQARRDAVAAQLAADRGEHAIALERRKAAFDGMRGKLGERHPLVAEFALAYAAALSDNGRDGEARALVAAWRPLIEVTFVADAPVRRQLEHWR
jgi:serine/threonine-protein kinase